MLGHINGTSLPKVHSVVEAVTMEWTRVWPEEVSVGAGGPRSDSMVCFPLILL